MPENYYLEKLYPLQDGVLKTVNALNTPFYLTGGTALSRFYFHHRYSDDLDLFVNDDPGFDQYIQAIITSLTERQRCEGFILDRQSLKKGEHFTQFFIEHSFPSGPNVTLKVDLINDIATRFGTLVTDSILGKIDDWRNILSNKLCAIFRFEAKDIVDLATIAQNKSFDWTKILAEAKEKEAGIDPLEIHRILTSFPVSELQYIKWIDPIDPDRFIGICLQMAEDILLGRTNTLYGR